MVRPRARDARGAELDILRRTLSFTQYTICMKQLLLFLSVLLLGAFAVACEAKATVEPVVSEPTFFLFYTYG